MLSVALRLTHLPQLVEPQIYSSAEIVQVLASLHLVLSQNH